MTNHDGTEIEAGDYVVAGKGEDRDYGQVLSVDADGVTVGWVGGAAKRTATAEEARAYDVYSEEAGAREAAFGTANSTITDDQIEALAIEAGDAGDDAQVELCRKALAGNESARERCAQAIAAARAQDGPSTIEALTSSTEESDDMIDEGRDGDPTNIFDAK